MSDDHADQVEDDLLWMTKVAAENDAKVREAVGQELTTAVRIAAATGLHIRTVYRSIARLRANGMPIRAQAGAGYLAGPFRRQESHG